MKPTKQAKPVRVERWWAICLPPPIGLLAGTYLRKADAIAAKTGYDKFIVRVEIRVIGGKK